MACIATRLKAAATTLALACALACAFGASGTQRAAAQSAVARCAGLDNFAQLAALSEHLFCDPVGNFSRSGLQQMLALTTTVERRTLQSRLTSRFRSLEYNDIKATLAHMRRAAEAGLIFERSELKRLVNRTNLAQRARTMGRTVAGLCGPNDAQTKPKGNVAKEEPFANLMTRAIRTNKAKKPASSRNSTSTLFLVYITLGGLLATVVIVPFVTGRVYAMILRRVRCQIPAKLLLGKVELPGQVIRLSMRGMNFALTPLGAAQLAQTVKQGAMCTIMIDGTKFRTKLSYMPNTAIPTVGLRLAIDLEPKQHRRLLRLSVIPPTREPRHAANAALG